MALKKGGKRIMFFKVIKGNQGATNVILFPPPYVLGSGKSFLKMYNT